MSKQSTKVQAQLARLKSQGILLPDDRNPRQLWLLIIMHPMDNNQGEVFVSHGVNYDKFVKRKGFEVIGHGFDRGALTSAARKLSVSLGPAYQPKFSNVKAALTRPVVEEISESQLVHSETPDDFMDAVGKITNQSSNKE